MNIYIKESLTILNKNFDKGLLLIHDDMDGRGCEILGKSFFPNKFDYIILKAGETDETLSNYLKSKEYDLIIMADLSFSEKETLTFIEKFNEQGNQFFLIDHHDNAMTYKDYPWAFVSIATDEVKNSGTELLYHFICQQLAPNYNKHFEIINNDTLRDLVELIRSYDTWDWFKDNNTNATKLVQLFEYNNEEFITNMITKVIDNTGHLFSEKDMVIIDILNNVNKKYVIKTAKERYDFNYHGYKYSFVVANQLQGLIANEIFAQDDSIEMIIFLVTVNKLSFRSTDEKFDTLIFSKKLNGGGHRNASGSNVPEVVINYMLEHILC